MKQFSSERLALLREKYPAGSRIRLTEMGSDPHPIPPGSTGTLLHIDDIGTFHVRWDNGRSLGLVMGEDRFSIQQPEPELLKLYMPLTADVLYTDEWGNPSSILFCGHNLALYEEEIAVALRSNQMPEEAQRGIMHWYGKDDLVNKKVTSVVFTTEYRDRQLWGVAECLVCGDLSPDEMETLKEYITGQAADGWGEGFEQREIRVDEGELYVHFWNDEDWSLQTEQELFPSQGMEMK